MGWLHSTFHFSFAEYYNPDKMNYGTLRVVNDDIFDAGHGFATHPHKNMEILSYVVEGVLTHQDSMGIKRELTRGQVQYMSAGKGVTHSEYNLTQKPLRFLQIWILPDQQGYTPQYKDVPYQWEERENKWLKIASSQKQEAKIVIHQDVEVSVLELKAGQQQTYTIQPDRMVYLIQIEGKSTINEKQWVEKDAAEVMDENIVLSAQNDSHFILFDLKKDQSESVN